MTSDNAIPTPAENPPAAPADEPHAATAVHEGEPHDPNSANEDATVQEHQEEASYDAADPEHPPAAEGEHPEGLVGEESGEESAPKKKGTRKPRKAKEAPEEEAAPAGTETAPAASGAPAADGTAEGSESKKKWYVVKVQSGREDSIKAAIERKVKIEGLEEFFGQIAIPVEELVQKKTVRVTDKKTGEKVTQERKVVKYQKKFPGYIFAEVEFNDRILYLFRETSGVGDFVGVKPAQRGADRMEPTPMTDREVRSMLTGVAEGEVGKPGGKQKVKLDYEKGDKVKIRDGAFANMEGIVKSITETKDTGETPKVKVEVTIFGRPVEVDLDYWHVDKV